MEERSLRIRLISDIHGNLPALERVLAHPEGMSCDCTICLGDVTGYGPWPSFCIETVKDVCSVTVAGNHDRGCAGLLPLQHFNRPGVIAIRWTVEHLSDDQMEWLAALPIVHRLNGTGFCHASPGAPGSWEYILDGISASEALERAGGGPWFYGHTHLSCAWGPGGCPAPADRVLLDLHPLVNCGSVGQPRDGDRRAAYMVADTERGTAETFRVDYPVGITVSEIRRVGLPVELGDRLFLGA